MVPAAAAAPTAALGVWTTPGVPAVAGVVAATGAGEVVPLRKTAGASIWRSVGARSPAVTASAARSASASSPASADAGRGPSAFIFTPPCLETMRWWTSWAISARPAAVSVCSGALPEDDVVARRIGAGPEGTGVLVGARVVVDADVTEVPPEAAFHHAARSRIERGAPPSRIGGAATLPGSRSSTSAARALRAARPRTASRRARVPSRLERERPHGDPPVASATRRAISDATRSAGRARRRGPGGTRANALSSAAGRTSARRRASRSATRP